ncbi:hypothetical protein SDRG_17029 [Saprolegnia diclina VS20]|uniref:Uncharacterized protein n=1 Tax=Saprolegnia diclina (strain VS20) TaxID=1156394 RepID=T0PI90_SAPDV|nr:hypothetical protein SDRG_17029 [Saprolegnia diclina VS20]EQC25084.1 hypothetical protein SDRG_17029 [Saprolegnia diclina VS20]|eukprot:XP_008621484.1 hypothetical protein SDRG_17029 [Saprolegnia diclina VS20]
MPVAHRRLDEDNHVRAITLLWLFIVLLACALVAKAVIVCLYATSPNKLANKPRAKTAVYIDPATLQSIVYIVALSPVHERCSDDDAAFSTTGRISNFGDGPMDDASVEWSITNPLSGPHSRV